MSDGSERSRPHARRGVEVLCVVPEAAVAPIRSAAREADAPVSIERATDRRSILDRVENGLVDCLVLDPSLPGVDGDRVAATSASPVVLYTDAERSSVRAGLLDAVDTIVEQGDPADSAPFLVEKVVGLIGRTEEKSEYALARALARVDDDAACEGHRFLVDDGAIVWASEPFESVFPVGSADATPPSSGGLYERLAGLLVDAPGAIRTVTRADRATDATTEETVAIPTDDGAVHFRHSAHELPGRVGDYRLEVFREVTPQVQREARLELLDLLVEQAQDGLYTLDENGVIDFCNESFAAMLGYERAAIIGRHAAEVLAEGELERGQRTVQHLQETDADSTTVDMTFLDRSGDRLEVSIHYTLLPSEDGSYAGLMGVARDITERERRRQELDLLRQVFARVLRHNLRSELSIIMGNTEVIMGEIDGAAQELAESVLERSEVLEETASKARAIEEVLDSEAGRTTQSAERMVDYAVESVQREFPDTAVETDLVPSLSVRAHPKLVLAVENLVENAIEHGEPLADRTGAPDLLVETAVEGDTVALSVVDGGPGIPDCELDVLERGTETALQHGSGLGLWLINWIVERSGGDLQFDREGGRTVATIALERGE